MTQPVVITISHHLGAAEARRRIETGFGRLVQQMPGAALAQFTQQWNGNQMRFAAKGLGQVVDGRIDVLDDSVRLEVTLPPLLAGLAERVKGRLQQAGQRLLGSR